MTMPLPSASSSALAAPAAGTAVSSPAVPLLTARGIDKFFGRGHERQQVLFGVDLDVNAGECLAVIGASGSGKSTLTRIMLGLETADAGSVAYDGQPITGRRGEAATRRLPGFQALRRESGLVFQDPFGSLDPRWSVARSVAEPLALRKEGKLTRQELAQRAADALAVVGLDPDEFLDRHPSQLSGGQAQRVAIARAIVAEPRVILADEPMSAIDVAARIQILDAFAAIRAAHPDMALIMVSHDLGVVQHIADRIVVLHDGRIEESGPTADILAHPTADYTRQLIAAATL